jgi:murein DD-endopeptidase MepM/ murein hydrolase activator NlpD
MSSLTTATLSSLVPQLPLGELTAGLQPSSRSGLDFAALLAAQDSPTMPAETAMPEAGPYGVGSAGANIQGGIEALLTYTLLRLVERLLNTTDETDSSTANAEAAGLPVTGRLTQGYHDGHHGLDIAVPIGTPIRSTQAGRVVQAGWNNQGYGNLVILENGPYRTYYAHLDQVSVQVGDTLGSGAVVGLSGNTGNSTGPHLHYEVRVNGVAIDPSETAYP